MQSAEVCWAHKRHNRTWKQNCKVQPRTSLFSPNIGVVGYYLFQFADIWTVMDYVMEPVFGSDRVGRQRFGHSGRAACSFTLNHPFTRQLAEWTNYVVIQWFGSIGLQRDFNFLAGWLTSQIQASSTMAVWLSACLILWIWLAAYRFCFGYVPVNKLIPATSLLWTL